MDNTLIKKYLNNELDVIKKNEFELAMEDDLFLKEGIEGLKLWIEDNPNENIDSLEEKINELLDL